MKRLLALIPVVAPLFSVGCGEIVKPPQPTYEISGVASVSKSDKTKYGFVDLAGTSADWANLKRPLNPREFGKSGKRGEVLMTDRIMKIEACEPGSTPYRCFYALLIPELSVNGPSGTAIARLHKTDPAVYLGEGSVFTWGERAIAETNWVKVCADSTTFAVQIVSSNLQRVYFLGPPAHTVRVFCCKELGTDGQCKEYYAALTDKLVELSGAPCYVEITPTSCTGTPPTPQPIPAPTADPVAPGSFIKTAKDIACEAGWPDSTCPL
jgi:hypothetical protein